jgi:predicted DNA-binding transcriptional regulator AlpA
MQALRIAAVSAKTGLAEQTIRNWTSMRQFPRPFKLGANVSVWDEADVDKWLLTKKQATCEANKK